VLGHPTLIEVCSFKQALERSTCGNETAVVFADGGSRGDPGPAGAGAVVAVNGHVVASDSKYCGITTNDVAQYTGLILGLEKALQSGFKFVEVRMDSEIVVKQMLGLCKVTSNALIPLYHQARVLVLKFGKFEINQVRREHNVEADNLANKAIDSAWAINFCS